MQNAGFYPVSELKYPDGTTAYLPQRELKDYNLKVVRSGDIIEIYKYEKKVYYDYEKFDRQYDKEKPEDWNGKSEKNLQRSRREIRRVIWANMTKYSKFLTLTYAENMTDLDTFYHDWKLFLQSMRRHGYDLKYLYVLEFQERGAIHAHVVIFNDQYIPVKVIENAWKKGFVMINSIRKVHNLGAYVCKYLTKDSLSEYNSKSFCTSRGLKRPVERKITLKEGADLYKELLNAGELIYSSKYPIIYNDIVANEVEYCQVRVATDFHG